MKHPNQPQGKVYRFVPKAVWDEDTKSHVQVPKIVLFHMVVVVDRSATRKGWVKVATVWARLRLISEKRTADLELGHIED